MDFQNRIVIVGFNLFRQDSDRRGQGPSQKGELPILLTLPSEIGQIAARFLGESSLNTVVYSK
jgi:hypothetical protein